MKDLYLGAGAHPPSASPSQGAQSYLLTHTPGALGRKNNREAGRRKIKGDPPAGGGGKGEKWQDQRGGGCCLHQTTPC